MHGRKPEQKNIQTSHKQLRRSGLNPRCWSAKAVSWLLALQYHPYSHLHWVFSMVAAMWSFELLFRLECQKHVKHFLRLTSHPRLQFCYCDVSCPFLLYSWQYFFLPRYYLNWRCSQYFTLASWHCRCHSTSQVAIWFWKTERRHLNASLCFPHSPINQGCIITKFIRAKSNL